MDKRTTIQDVVAEIRDGMTIGIGGWGSRRKPMAIVREILRSDLKDLTIVSYGGPDVGLLCKTGKAKKVVCVVLCDELQSVDGLDGEDWCARYHGRAGWVVQECSFVEAHTPGAGISSERTSSSIFSMYPPADRKSSVSRRLGTRPRAPSRPAAAITCVSSSIDDEAGVQVVATATDP